MKVQLWRWDQIKSGFILVYLRKHINLYPFNTCLSMNLWVRENVEQWWKHVQSKHSRSSNRVGRVWTCLSGKWRKTFLTFEKQKTPKVARFFCFSVLLNHCRTLGLIMVRSFSARPSFPSTRGIVGLYGSWHSGPSRRGGWITIFFCPHEAG